MQGLDGATRRVPGVQPVGSMSSILALATAVKIGCLATHKGIGVCPRRVLR